MRKLFCANWKMNKTLEEGREFINNLYSNLNINSLSEKKEIIIFPNFCLLASLSKLINSKKYNIKLGAQNFFPAFAGAFTGEVSIEILKSVGAEYFLIGHSERRNIIAESQEFIDKKIRFALQNKVKIIYCFGESLEERENNQLEKSIKKQLEIVKEINISNNFYLAYEPVWAIGTGRRAKKNDIVEMIKLVEDMTKGKITSLIYGGSISDENIEELSQIDALCGYLVGSASLDERKFATIIMKG